MSSIENEKKIFKNLKEIIKKLKLTILLEL